MGTQFTEKIRFNQLKEGDLFTFRKNGESKGYHTDDELLRYDKVVNAGTIFEKKCNAWFKINNTRSWVWRAP